MANYGAARRARPRPEAIEARGTGFREGTNMGAAPNSQGTLFQGGKPTAEHRWPRGYSPTRMQEVKDLVPVRVSHNPEELHAAAPVQDFGHPYLNPDSVEHTKRLMREPIARSTLTAHDLAGFGGMHLRANRAGVKDLIASSASAEYRPPTKGVFLNPVPSFGTDRGEDPHYWSDLTGGRMSEPAKYVSQRQALPNADTTVLHEVGHHVDFHSNMQSYVEQADREGGFERGGRGRAESTADALMLQHYRNDPRNQRQTNFDAHKTTYGQRIPAGSSQLPRGYQDPSKHAGSGGAPGMLRPQQFGKASETKPLWSGTLADEGVPGAGREAYNGRIV